MRILAIALAAVTLLSLAGLAEATTLNGVGNVPTATRDYSPVENVAAVRVAGPMELTGFADRMVDADAFRVGYARPYVAPYVAHPYVRPYGYHPYRYRY